MATSAKSQADLEALADNPYPGQGIILGVLPTEEAVQIYWVMGRSEGSRDRRLTEGDDGGIRTDALDKSSTTISTLVTT